MKHQLKNLTQQITCVRESKMEYIIRKARGIKPYEKSNYGTIYHDAYSRIKINLVVPSNRREKMQEIFDNLCIVLNNYYDLDLTLLQKGSSFASIHKNNYRLKVGEYKDMLDMVLKENKQLHHGIQKARDRFNIYKRQWAKNKNEAKKL